MVEKSRQAGSEPIEGYVLRERLGAGGYGEVWRCDAPGGLQKAIKFIYGGAGGKQSESELKSLRRISKVYHPFLLSIERIEDVEGQTIIITELAESSLEQRLNHYLRAGATGIPRGELLEYFRDAADALDFLSNEHSLQHLDVKPGNLLIVANRIKVGDFGLVKDLNDIQQSCVSGMTPAYSAPEVFDGRPDVRSDQYSLAVTYVELLTGKLPFTGASMAELAKQHLHSPPQLDWLPPADREVVARALFKDPTDRFVSCRQFIDQLIRAKLSRVPVQQQEERAQPSGATTQKTAIGTELAPIFKPRLGPENAPTSSTPQRRSLYIGLGGIGIEALVSLKQHLEPESEDTSADHEAHWLAIDTDPGNRLCSSISDTSVSAGPLREDEQLCLPLNSPDVYRRAPDGTFKSLSRRWLFNIPRSLRTEGIRPLALLAMTSQLAAVRRVVAEKLDTLLSDGNSPEIETRVYLLSSLHGATGSGLLAEVGLLIQDLAQILLPGTTESVDVRALVSAAAVSRAGPARMGPASALATLNELAYHMSASRVVPTLDGSTGTYSRRKPFSWVGMVDGGKLDVPSDRNRAIIQLVSAALLDSSTEASTALTRARSGADGEQHWLRALAVDSLDVQDHLPTEQFSVFCATQVLGGAIRPLQSNSEVSEENAAAFVDSLLEALQDFGAIDTLSAKGSERWKARLAQTGSEQQTQLLLDVEELRKQLLTPLSANRITWPNIEQLIQATIQRFGTHKTHLAEQHIELLSAIAEQTEEQTVKCLSRYFESLGDQLQRLCEEFSQLRGARAQTLNTALATLAGPLSGETGRQLASRISRSRHARSLLSLVSAEAEKRLDELLPIDQQPKAIDCPSFVRMITDIAISAAADLPLKLVSSKSAVVESAKELNDEFGKLIPTFIQSGGDASRIVVGNAHKLQELTQLLALAPSGEETSGTTTLIESTQYSDETLLIHDCDNIPLPLFIRRAWRPTDETFVLAEKLRTRVDVEWPSVDTLVFEQVTARHSSQPIATANPDADPWLQPSENSALPGSAPSMQPGGGTVEL